MKRVGLFLVCLAFVFATSGCGNKKLDCTMKTDEMNTHLKMNFDSKDQFKDGTVIYEIEAEKDTTDEEMKKAKQELEDFYKESGFDVNVEIKDEKLVVTMDIDKDDFDKLGLETEDASYDAILKEINSEKDVTCKK